MKGSAILIFALAAMVSPGTSRAQTPGSSTSSTTTGLGGSSMTALLVANQNQLVADMANSEGVDFSTVQTAPLSAYRTIYQQSGGGPTLQWLGVPLSQITNTAAFQAVYWGVILIAGALTSVKAMHAIRFGGGNVVEHLAGFYLKLAAGVLIAANPGFVYAATMTLRDAFLGAVTNMVTTAPNVANALQSTNMTSMNLDLIKSQVVQSSIDERIGITQKFTSDTDRQNMAAAMNALATAVNGVGQAGSPQIEVETAAQIANETLSESIMATQFRESFTALAGMTSPAQLSISVPSGAAVTIPTFGTALTDPNSAAGQARNTALTTPQNGPNQATVQQAINTYKEQLAATMKDQLDQALNTLLPAVSQASGGGGLFNWLKGKAVGLLEAAASGLVDPIEKLMQMLVGLLNILISWIIARFLNIALNLYIELNVALLIVVMPLWLMPGTPQAFTGVVRSLFNASLIMPVFQILMFLTDAIYAKVLSYAAAGAAGGLLVAPWLGPMVMIGIMLGYFVAYLVTIVVLLKKTPAILSGLFKGAGAVSGAIGGVLTGMAAGVMTAAGIAAAPAVIGAGSAALGGAGSMAAGGAAKAAAGLGRFIPSSVRAASSRIGAMASRAANSSAGQTARNVAQRSFTGKLYQQAAAAAQASGGGAASAAPSTAKAAQAVHPSFRTPFAHAFETAAKEVTAGAGSDDPHSYLNRRGQQK